MSAPNQPPDTPLQKSSAENAWIQLRFHIDNQQVEALEDALLAAGAIAVVYEDQQDEPLLEPAVGETPLWQQLVVTGLFDASLPIETILSALQDQWPQETLPEYQLEVVADRQWEREWMVHYQPIRFGRRLWVCPSWIEQPDPQATNLILDPGLAFGTGTHPTTALCLEWLDGQQLQGKTVLDYGCGSGILAIAALLLGARQAIAVDHDPQALSATIENARRNNIDTSALIIKHSDELHADSTQADIVIANILAGPLLRLAPQLAAITTSHGHIALSGILQEQYGELSDCYSQWFKLKSPIYRQEWVLITGQKDF